MQMIKAWHIYANGKTMLLGGVAHANDKSMAYANDKTVLLDDFTSHTLVTTENVRCASIHMVVR